MKLFRVRGVDAVEPFLSFQRLDGVSYIPVGGTNRSYISLSKDLAMPRLRRGRVTRASYIDDEHRRDSIILVPEFKPVENTPEELAAIEKDCNTAFIVVCSGAYNFDAASSPVRVGKMVCRVITMQPGERISAFPECNSISEMNAAKRALLSYDGDGVTFTTDR